MNLKHNFKTMLCDTHDANSVSSKRVITLIAFTLCVIAFIANLFFDYTMDAFIYETMAWIVLGGFGMTGLEKFANSNNSTTEPTIENKSNHNRWEEQKVDTHP
jgi:hypothetical protein